MRLQKDLSELQEAGVISQDTADDIRAYYDRQKESSNNRLVVIFGILGAMLVGLGIILILAHNWDQLERSTKTAIAFTPLIVGQLVCGYVFLKKGESMAWRESATAFLVFAVGASIALVSQIYNIPGDLGSFFLTWTVLCVPLIYVMNSSMASLLCLIGMTYYAADTGYWSHPQEATPLYWLLFLAVMPHYYRLLKAKPQSNFTIFHHWFVPLSVVITLGTVASRHGELMFVAYMSLFSTLYLVGGESFFSVQKGMNNGYRVLGALGTLVVLLILSFTDFWQELRAETFAVRELVVAPEFLASLILSLLAVGLLYLRYRHSIRKAQPQAFTFLVFIIIFIIGAVSAVSVVMVNMLVLALALLTILQGVKKEHLGIMNYGLLIVTALITCRFFDTDLSFVLRGLLFVTVGAGFFVANYWMVRKIKTHDDK